MLILKHASRGKTDNADVSFYLSRPSAFATCCVEMHALSSDTNLGGAYLKATQHVGRSGAWLIADLVDRHRPQNCAGGVIAGCRNVPQVGVVGAWAAVPSR